MSVLNFHKKKKDFLDWHSFIVSLPFNTKHALASFRHNGTGAPWNWWAHEELDALQEWRWSLHVVGDRCCIYIWRIVHGNMVVCFLFLLHEQGILRMSAISIVIAILAFTSLSNLLVLNNNAEVPPCSVPWQHGNGHSPNHDQEILLPAVTDWKVWTKTLDASWSWVVWLNVSLLQLSRRLVQLIQNRLVHFLDLYWRDLHAVDGNWNGSNCRRLIIIKISTPRWGEFSDATHPNWHSIMWSCTGWWSICQV